MKIAIHEHTDSNSFLHKYITGDLQVMELFDYPLTDDGLAQRLQEISSRNYIREQLSEVLYRYNKKFTNAKATFRQIERLKDERSVVVVGGQQAGLLTGPLYTVNKVISILHEAAFLENKLSIPVIPIFWIAGEDHDIDEVNHTFFHHEDKVKRIKIAERNDWKIPVSERKIKKEVAEALIKEAFQFLSETEHTKHLVNSLLNDVKEDITYVEWFSLLIHRLFYDTGLVIMDANDPSIRQLEKDFFREMIVRNDALRRGFLNGAEMMKNLGFGEPITVDEDNAHLFIHKDGERLLLEKKDDQFFEKQGERSWTENELLQLLNRTPFPFSNNVVTRPVIQDMILPVIAFIAGPGELKYWGTLKKVFHTFQICMPLVYPRAHMTFISRKTEKNLAWIGVSPQYVLTNRLDNEKERWINVNVSSHVDEIFTDVLNSMEKIDRDLFEQIQFLDKDMEMFHQRYMKKIVGVFEEYKKKVQLTIKNKNSAIYKRFTSTETELIPEGVLQERLLNIIPFLNMYGEDLLQRLVHLLNEENSLVGKNIFIYL